MTSKISDAADALPNPEDEELEIDNILDIANAVTDVPGVTEVVVARRAGRVWFRVGAVHCEADIRTGIIMSDGWLPEDDAAVVAVTEIIGRAS